MQTMLHRPAPLTVAGVYKTLRQIAVQKGQGSAARRQQAVLGMLRSCRYITMTVSIMISVICTVTMTNGSCNSLLGFKLMSSPLPACGVQPGYGDKPRHLLPFCVVPSADMRSAKLTTGKAEQFLAPHAPHQQCCLSHTAYQASSTCPIPLDKVH